MSYYKKGFTFLEIVIVVLVIGILAAIAMPKFVELRNEAINSVEKSIVGSIRQGIANWYAKSVISTAGNPAFPSALDLAALGNAAQNNPLFTEVLQPAIINQWRKTGPYSYLGPIREYFYDKTNGAFDQAAFNQDMSLNRNDGAVFGASLIDGSPYGSGKSTAFDGVNDYVDAGTSDIFNFGTESFTIEAWIKPDTLSNSYREFISKGSQSPLSGWALAAYSDGRLSFSGLGYWEVVSPTSTITTNTWQHIAVVRDGTTYKLYKDGVNVGTLTRSESLEASSESLKIGMATNYPDNRFSGSLTDVRISDNARYTSNFTPPTEPLGADSNTVGLWRLGE